MSAAKSIFLYLFFPVFLYRFSAGAQVPNNDFENRIQLQAGQPVTSNTVGSTVQQNCVDEKLTGKCVEYHNDQWFEFTPRKSGNYFINISGQECRDVRGVQLVVFTGEPCKTETYQILSCTSLGSLDDVFVPLPNAKTGTTYYLNVDGYLHDFCIFKLEISTNASGQPAAALPFIPPVSSQRTVRLQWTLPDTISASTFHIWRRRADESRSKLLQEVRVIRNAYGQAEKEYALTDTLTTAGSYFYQVNAAGLDAPVQVYQLAYHWRPAHTRKYVNLPLDEFSKKAELTIIASDPSTGKVLRRSQMVKQKEGGLQAVFMLQHPDLEPGQKIRVTIIENKRSGPVSRDFWLEVVGSGE